MRYIALIPALLHLFIFWIETWGWGTSRSSAAFGVAKDQIEVIRPWAFNQGWYNLFLAIAAGIGVFWPGPIGFTLVLYSLGSMTAAALVLLISSPDKARSAAIQGLPAVIGLLCFIFA